MTRDTLLTIAAAALCLVPVAGLMFDAPPEPALIEQCPDGVCPAPTPADQPPTTSPPSPAKCAGAGGGFVAGLLLLARLAFSSGYAPWLGPFFDWLATRRQPPPAA